MMILHIIYFEAADSRARRPNLLLTIIGLLIILAVALTTGCQETDETNKEDNLEIGMLIPITGTAVSVGDSARSSGDTSLKTSVWNDSQKNDSLPR